jgi:hypothetical protein
VQPSKFSYSFDKNRPDSISYNACSRVDFIEVVDN